MHWRKILVVAMLLVPAPLSIAANGGGPACEPEAWASGVPVPVWSWGPPAAAAQQTPEVDMRRDRMRTFLVLRISDALNLPEEKALQVSKVLRDAEEKRRDLNMQRSEVERNLRSALEQQKPDPAAIAKLVAQANELDGQIAMIPENSFRQVQGLLTVEQQARLVLLRPELQAQVRRNVERRFGERGRPPAPPAPPPGAPK
jgi:hypothetical protein